MQQIEIRDHRNKEWFWIDDEYLNGYARLLKPASTLVYLALCRHANKEQISWPSIELLCEKLNLSNKTVISAIKELESWNIVSVSRSKDVVTKRQNPNIYTLLSKKVWKEKPSVKNGLGSIAECNSGQKPSVNDDQKPSVPGTLEVNTYKDINTVEVNTLEKVDNRVPDIQELWEYGLTIGFSSTKQKLQRFALKRLLGGIEKDKLRRAAELSQQIKSERYAPQVNNWMDLEDKYLNLRNYFQRNKPQQTYEYGTN